jgi:hypothetical protein
MCACMKVRVGCEVYARGDCGCEVLCYHCAGDACAGMYMSVYV